MADKSYAEILAEKLSRLKSVPNDFVNGIESVSDEVYKETLKIINSMDFQDGLFVYNEKNLNIINSISKTLNKTVYQDEFTQNLTGFIKEFDTQSTYNIDLFSLTIDNFEVKDIYAQTVYNSQSNALDLYSESNFTSQISTPLKNVLNSAVTQNMSIGDVSETITTLINGTKDVDGALVKYAKTTAFDTFAVADRTHYQAIATDYAVEWYRYVGGEIEDTRCFCQERHGHWYHIDNVRAWGEGKDLGECRSGDLWQGANKGTNSSTIFQFVGGYNCKHSLLASSLSKVPAADLNNAIEKGFYKPKK